MKTFKQFLSESPQLVDPDTFGLEDEAKNKAMLQTFLKNKVSVIKKYPNGDELFETKKDPERQIVLHLKETDTIGYLVHHVNKIMPLLGNTVTQVKIWRSIPYAPSGLARTVFFDVLLKRFKTIVSDRFQTARGKEFWVQQLNEANRQGYRVGLLDEEKQLMEWFDPKKETYSSWFKRVEREGWGLEDKNSDMRFVISSKK